MKKTLILFVLLCANIMAWRQTHCTEQLRIVNAVEQGIVQRGH